MAYHDLYNTKPHSDFSPRLQIRSTWFSQHYEAIQTSSLQFQAIRDINPRFKYRFLQPWNLR